MREFECLDGEVGYIAVVVAFGLQLEPQACLTAMEFGPLDCEVLRRDLAVYGQHQWIGISDIADGGG